MLFISYAHEDGIDLARRLHSDLAGRGHDVWLDRSRLLAGASWSADIERAIDQSQIVLALLSRGSFGSSICRAEQLRALRRGKRVIPVTLSEDADRPLFLETAQYVSFIDSRPYAEALAELIAAISGSASATLTAAYRETYVTAPRTLANVSRPAELMAVRESVLQDKSSAMMTIAALVGMGGIGKTTLAQMLCHDPIVKDAYPDGIIWVSLGQELPDLTPKVREVGRALYDDTKHYDTIDGASNRLKTILRRKAALIVLDDVWTLAQTQPFLADAPASGLLITTRKHDIPLSLHARLVPVGALSREQSLDILAQWTATPAAQLPPAAAEIVRECGRLPLALAMIGGIVRRGLSQGRVDAWEAALRRLATAQLDRIEFPLEQYPYSELQRAIQVSVDALDERSRDRYLTMGTFAEDIPVPEQALATIWKADRYEVQDIVDTWLAASLASRDKSGGITLHDLQLDYVRKVAPQSITALHRQVVERYAEACQREWSRGPKDGYFFERIAWHMAGAEDWKGLSGLLLDGAFVRARLGASSYLDMRQDFNWSSQCLAVIDDPNERRLLTELGAAIQQFSGFVNRHVETSALDRWFENSKSRCLFIEGPGGIGKSLLMRHLWIRRMRESIWLDLSLRAGPSDPLSLLVAAVGTRIDLPPRAFESRQSFLPEVVDEIRGALQRSHTTFVVFIDAIDEQLMSGHTRHEFLRAIASLAGDLRFVIAGRKNPLNHQLETHLADIEWMDLEGMSSFDVASFFKGKLGSNIQHLDPDTLAALVEHTAGSPLVASLMIEAIKSGASGTEVLEGVLDVSAPYRRALDRTIQRLEHAGIPVDVLRSIASQSTRGTGVALDETPVPSTLRSSLIEVLRNSGLFSIEQAEDRSVIRVAHASVAAFLQDYYGLTSAEPS